MTVFKLQKSRAVVNLIKARLATSTNCTTPHSDFYYLVQIINAMTVEVTFSV